MSDYINQFNKYKYITSKIICKFKDKFNKLNNDSDDIKHNITKIDNDINFFKNKINQNNLLIFELIEQIKNKDIEYNEKINNLNQKINSLNTNEKNYNECFPEITNELFPTFGKTIYFNQNKGNFLFSNFGHIKKLVTNSFTNVSDKKLKKNIKPIKNSLSKIKKLNGVYYKWKDSSINKKKNIGFIAQDIKKIIPEVVNKIDNNTLGIEYDKLTPIIVESIKELDKKINNINLKNKFYNYYLIICFIFLILFFIIWIK